MDVNIGQKNYSKSHYIDLYAEALKDSNKNNLLQKALESDSELISFIGSKRKEDSFSDSVLAKDASETDTTTDINDYIPQSKVPKTTPRRKVFESPVAISSIKRSSQRQAMNGMSKSVKFGNEEIFKNDKHFQQPEKSNKNVINKLQVSVSSVRIELGIISFGFSLAGVYYYYNALLGDFKPTFENNIPVICCVIIGVTLYVAAVIYIKRIEAQRKRVAIEYANEIVKNLKESPKNYQISEQEICEMFHQNAGTDLRYFRIAILPYIKSALYHCPNISLSCITDDEGEKCLVWHYINTKQ